MTQGKRIFFSGCLLLLLMRAVAFGQLPVTDAGNLSQNTISAIQSVLTTIQTVLIEANQILDLTALDDIAVAGGIVEDMKLLSKLVDQAEGLSYDLSSLEAQIIALFHLETAPTTRDGLTVRLAEIKRMKFLAYSYVTRVQTLFKTALRTVEHLQGLLETVGALLGNKQGHQTAMQTQAVMSKHITNLDVQITAYQRAKSIDALSDALITESVRKIQESRMEDWPTF